MRAHQVKWQVDYGAAVLYQYFAKDTSTLPRECNVGDSPARKFEALTRHCPVARTVIAITSFCRGIESPN